MTQQELVTTAPPEATKAQKAADDIFAMAEAYVVDSPEMFEIAGSELQSIRDRHKKIEEQRVYLKEPFLEGGRRIDAFFKAPLDRLAEAERLLKSRMLTYKQGEEAKAAEARRQAEEKARKEREELERQRKAAEDEQRRIAEQARRDREESERKAAEARKAGDEAAARKAEQEARERLEQARIDAQAAEEAAHAAAEELELAEVAPLARPVVEQPKASGISTRQTWKAEVLNLNELIIAAAAGLAKGDPTMAAYLMADTKALGQVAKGLKGKARIPGVRVYAEESMAVRSAA